LELQDNLNAAES